MSFFRSLFGDSAEVLEERGDALRLSGQWREAAWFYGRARAASRSEPHRQRLEEREAEAIRQAFRQMLDEAESLGRRRMNAEALELLADASRFVRNSEDEAILAARRMALAERSSFEANGSSPARMEATPADGEPRGLAGNDSEVERAFDDRLVGRPESERRRFESLGAHGRQGFVQLGNGDFPASLESFERENVIHPESWVVRELMAQALEGLGRSEEACQQYEAAYRRAPDRTVLLLEIARVLRDRLGRPGDALDRLEEAARHHPPGPDTLDLHLERVILRQEQGRSHDAIHVVTELMTEPTLNQALLAFNRAGLFESMERWDDAAADLQTAMSLEPQNILYLERMADLIYRARRDPEEGLRLLDQALTVDAHDFAGGRGGLGTSPDRARLQFKAARILFLLDRFADAGSRIEEGLIVSHDPRVHEALLGLRREIRAAGQADLAEQAELDEPGEFVEPDHRNGNGSSLSRNQTEG